MLSFFSSLLLRSHLELHLFTSHHSSSGASSGALVNQVVAYALHLKTLLLVARCTRACVMWRSKPKPISEEICSWTWAQSCEPYLLEETRASC